MKLHMPKTHVLCFTLDIGIKSRGIKWISVVLIGLLLLGSLSACIHITEDSAETIINHLIPFVNTANRWNTVTLLEKDEYGRQLFLSCSVDEHNNVFSDFSGDTIYTYIVVQMETEEMSFCYQDSCYMYAPSDSSNETINQIKTANDWGKPLEPQKMTVLTKGVNGLWAVSFYEKDEIRNALKEKVEFSDSYIDVVYSSQKVPYFILREVERQETPPHKFGRAWIVSVDESNHLKAYAELENHPCDWISDINEFINANPGTPHQSGDG